MMNHWARKQLSLPKEYTSTDIHNSWARKMKQYPPGKKANENKSLKLNKAKTILLNNLPSECKGIYPPFDSISEEFHYWNTLILDDENYEFFK